MRRSVLSSEVGNNTWTGQFPDLSPPVFGSFGPQPISGNMLCFAGWVADYQGSGESASGLFTAFPYFENSFLVPVLIDDTEATQPMRHGAPEQDAAWHAK